MDGYEFFALLLDDDSSQESEIPAQRLIKKFKKEKLVQTFFENLSEVKPNEQSENDLE